MAAKCLQLDLCYVYHTYIHKTLLEMMTNASQFTIKYTLRCYNHNDKQQCNAIQSAKTVPQQQQNYEASMQTSATRVGEGHRDCERAFDQ